MYTEFSDVMDIVVYTIGRGFGYAMLFGLISWGVWVCVDLFRAASRG